MSYLSVTVYVEDVNDHDPKFLSTPYKVSVDELTPTGKFTTPNVFTLVHLKDNLLVLMWPNKTVLRTYLSTMNTSNCCLISVEILHVCYIIYT